MSRYTSLLLLAACAATVAAAPAASAKSSPTCAALAKQNHYKTFARSKEAIVFGRAGKRVVRGCVTGARRSFLLDALCCGPRFKLAGRYVGYAYEGSAIGDETSKVGAIDLRTGKNVSYPKIAPNMEGAGREIETGSQVAAYFITKSGTLVWVTYDQTGGTIHAGDRAERVVDQGAIDLKSVKVSADGRTITYTKDGAPASAPLNR
jgi:hypothetical protein